jgi:hypothetical protein
MMYYWVFVVKDHYMDGDLVSALDIAKERVGGRFWLISKRYASMKALSEGGSAVFYATGRDGRFFVGDGTFSTSPRPLDIEMSMHAKGHPSEKMTHYIRFDTARLWQNPVKVEDLVEKLSFISRKEKWYVYFRGSLRRIPEQDYNIIMTAANSQP